MILTATIMLFVLAATAVYSLIVSRKNYLLVFFLTPVLLISSIYSGYTLYALQGTPINKVPVGEVEIVWVEFSNPDILFLARDVDTGGHPKYYRIPYTEHNRSQMQQAMDGTQAGEGVMGSFQGQQNNDDDTGEINFIAPDAAPLPPKPIGNQQSSFNLYTSR